MKEKLTKKELHTINNLFTVSDGVETILVSSENLGAILSSLKIANIKPTVSIIDVNTYVKYTDTITRTERDILTDEDAKTLDDIDAKIAKAEAEFDANLESWKKHFGKR